MRKFLLLLATILVVSCSEQQKFRLITSDVTGIDFNNKIIETDSFHIMSYEYIYNGAGVGAGDLNNDGLTDLVFAGNQVSSRVYLNLGNFKFRDITSNFDGLTNNQWYSGVALADVNNDGQLDVYLTSTKDKDPEKCKNRLWINQGMKDGKGPFFKEMAEQYGIAEKGQSVSAAFFDYDCDGYLDLYVENNTVTQRMNTSYRTKITDGSAANNDRLYHNNGNGTFTDVTSKAGIRYEGFGLGIAVGDVNKDGYPDIYVSNDYISNDLLYINQKDGTFKNEISKYMSYQSKSSMGDDMVDINNDGFLDMFTLDMMPENYYKRKQTINGFSYIFYVNDQKFGYEHQFLRNMLHLNNGLMNGQLLPYSEIGQMLGIYATDWTWSPLFADYNNDGNKDLIISNGYPKDLTDKDWTKYKAKVLGYLASEQDAMNMAPAWKSINIAFENMGNLSFEKRKNWLPQVPSFSYGAVFVDLDNDGDLDYVCNNIDDPAFIMRNYTIEGSPKETNYIRILLKGKQTNTEAIGAKVELWSSGKYQYAEHFLTRGYASSVDPVIHFGLGKNTTIDSIRVTWPSNNNISVLKSLKADQIITIDEKDSHTPFVNPDTSENGGLMFAKCDSLIDYFHNQTDFIDFFFKQNIIQHKFSQIGPVIAKGDLNGDGKEDLVIGSTNEMPTTALVRKGGRFEKTEFPGLTIKKNYTESDLSVIDFDGDGDMDIVAIAGGYENQDEKEYQHLLYENNKGSFTALPLPIPPFPASVIRPYDYDKDGKPDLFVGARVMKGKFPYSNKSWLIHNDNGRIASSTAKGFDLGMVTDAVWTDFDRDGWEDLLVVREWDSPVLLKNMNGKELVPRKIPELEKYHGLWYSIAAADLNGDGCDDYIAGNLGENARYTASDKYPLQMYAIDLDNNGIIDPVMTGYWKDINGKMKEYPVNYLDELYAQSGFFQKKFQDYKSFSFADMNQIMDETVKNRVEFKLYVNTTSSYIIWNNKGNLSFEKLPRILQVSPITKTIMRDFNGDGKTDILLGGNDYSYDVSTGYFDANKGFILLNHGKGEQFEVLSPSRTGILLQGMLQSLQCIDGDTLMIVAGFNRAKTEVFRQLKK